MLEFQESGADAWIEVEARRPRLEVAIEETTPLVARRSPVSEPIPRLVVVALVKSALTKCDVVEAKIPFCAKSGEEVAAEMTPKLTAKVKSSAFPPTA